MATEYYSFLEGESKEYEEAKRQKGLIDLWIESDNEKCSSSEIDRKQKKISSDTKPKSMIVM